MYFCLLRSTEKSIFHRVDKVGERSIRRRLKVHSWYDKDKHKDRDSGNYKDKDCDIDNYKDKDNDNVSMLSTGRRE